MTDIRLEDFTSQYDVRTFLRTPFNRDGKTLACNGHAMVIFPLQDDYDELDPEKFTNCHDLMTEIDAAVYAPMPEVYLPDPITCGVCKGKGKATLVDCEECEGEGTVSFKNDFHDYDVTCKSCNGDGEILERGTDVCYNCYGTGKRYESMHSIKVGDIFLKANYLALIINAPDLTVCTTPDKLLFKAGQVSGAIMAVTP